MNPADVRLDALGFPIPPTFDGIAEPVESKPRARRGTFTIRLLLVALAVGAGIMALLRAELAEPFSDSVGQWLANHAAQKYEADNLDGALADLDRAVAWSGKSPAILMMRSQVRLEKGDLVGSLADCNRIVTLAPRSSRAYEQRSRVLQRMERHEDAIRDISQAVSLRRTSDPRLLNARAYTRAIAHCELDAAYEDIQKAIGSEGENPEYLDTRGFIYFLKGEYSLALADLNKALEIAAENFGMQGFFLGGDHRHLRMRARDRRIYEQSMAVMYHHRGEIYDKLGNAELAQADLSRGDELGYNPEAGVY